MDQLIVFMAAAAFVLLTLPAVIAPLLSGGPNRLDTRTTVRHLTLHHAPRPGEDNDLRHAA